jgi:hypothetical protein
MRRGHRRAFILPILETVLKRLSNRPESVNIIVLDACRNNPFPAGKRSGSRGLAGLSRSPEGTLIAYSTAPGSTADDGDGENTVYTAALSKAMKREGLDLYRIFMETRREVKAKTKGRQITWVTESLTDTVYLIPPREPETAPVPPPPQPTPAVVQVQPLPRPPAPTPAPPAATPPTKAQPPRGFVLIEAGSFRMGSPPNQPGRDNDETPHDVRLTRSFYLQETEVTQGQWRSVMGNNPSRFRPWSRIRPEEDLTPNPFPTREGE